MCVSAFAWQAHPDWLLVAIGNRDEFHERPAAPLARWDDDSGIIAGRDLRSGGTWLGVSDEGRFALVTNLRGYGAADSSRTSRGELVTGQLTGKGRYADPETADLGAFNPFNLIVANRREARFLCNRPREVRTALAHGIYGLSNGALDEPWPKTLQLKATLLDWLNGDHASMDGLFGGLANETLPNIGVHPTRPSDIRPEAPDTPVFIRDPIYGTRCSTIVAIGADGTGTVLERRFNASGETTGNTRLEFRWPM